MLHIQHSIIVINTYLEKNVNDTYYLRVYWTQPQTSY